MQSPSSDRFSATNPQSREKPPKNNEFATDGWQETTVEWEAQEYITEQETAGEVADEEELSNEPIWFGGEFVGCMDMYADIGTVAEYFDDHPQWFRRCAHPMQAEPLGENGYALTIGRFGALGYQVEPKIGLELLPQDRGVYRIRTISIPNYTPPGYIANFEAEQKLVETDAEDVQHLAAIGDEIMEKTRVQWHLLLQVGVRFPKFIHKLPMSLIRKTGDRLLAKIVCQVSYRLTHKVQEDFHGNLGEERLRIFKKMAKKKKYAEICRQVSQIAGENQAETANQESEGTTG
ncbi:DUF1997 domain-containing protein [Geitlerinema sp. PCC 9228]|uniref:DUF1997 domain-containing protein n=1 Tax=Geitlerinema sp. PCC 9228 TaxID=111611 RepID=UPI0008F9B315|nr:DUF1997 domain-containing protein [Geitlerinema sp. PCC 9228]